MSDAPDAASSAQPWEPDEGAGEVVEGARPPRRGLPRWLVGGVQGVCVVVVLVWGAVVLADGAEPVVTPAATVPLTPAVGDDRPEEPPFVDPSDPDFNQYLRALSVEGSLRALMGNSVITLDVPATPLEERKSRGGWTRFGRSYLVKDTVGGRGAEAVVYWTPIQGGGGAMLCPLLLDYPAGPSGGDFAAAVSRADGTDLVSGPVDIKLGGHGRDAQYMVLKVREDLGCDPGYFYTWQFVLGGPLWSTSDVGDTIRVWIASMEGGMALFIAGVTKEQASPELEQEIEQIVESIRIE